MNTSKTRTHNNNSIVLFYFCGSVIFSTRKVLKIFETCNA